MNYENAKDIVEEYLNGKPKAEIIETFFDNVSKKRLIEIARLIINK